MGDHNRPFGVEQAKRFRQDRGLRGGGPAAAARPIAVPESWPVDGNGAIFLSGATDDATDQEVFDHGAIAVQEYNRPALSLLDIVKTCAACRHKPAFGRVGQFGLPCVSMCNEGGAGQSNACNTEKTACASGGPRPVEICG